MTANKIYKTTWAIRSVFNYLLIRFLVITLLSLVVSYVESFLCRDYFFSKNNEDEMQTWGDWPIVMLKQKKDMTKKKM